MKRITVSLTDEQNDNLQYLRYARKATLTEIVVSALEEHFKQAKELPDGNTATSNTEPTTEQL